MPQTYLAELYKLNLISKPEHGERLLAFLREGRKHGNLSDRDADKVFRNYQALQKRTARRV
jgi:hypothetical protein